MYFNRYLPGKGASRPRRDEARVSRPGVTIGTVLRMNPRALTLFVPIYALLSALVSAVVEDEDDPKYVNYMKEMKASAVDSQLPGIPFEQWLSSILPPYTEIRWGVNDCGEGGDRTGPVPTCVGAEATLGHCRKVLVNVAVGASDKGIEGKPVFFFG